MREREIPRLDWLTDELAHGERLMWHGRPGRRWYLRPLIGLALGAIATLAIALLTDYRTVLDLFDGEFRGDYLLTLTVVALAIFTLPLTIFRKVLPLRHRQYALTNRRLLVHDGAREQAVTSIDGWEIVDFSVKENADGSGTIRIVTDDDTKAGRSIVLATALESADKAEARLDLIDVENVAGARVALETMMRESTSS